MKTTSQQLAGWILLLVIGFALGTVFMTLIRQNRPNPIEIIPPPPALTPQPAATAPPTTTPAPLRVHVSGAVVSPAVYALPPGSIVDDAVKAAGGFAATADTVAVNLAQELANGMQIYVPEQNEADAPPPVRSAPAAGGVDLEGLFTGLVNINAATAAELEALPGIGPALAADIVAFREANGPFGTIESIMDVPGIGEGKFEAIRALIGVGP